MKQPSPHLTPTAPPEQRPGPIYPLPREIREQIAADIADAKTAMPGLLVQLADSARKVREHDHSTQAEDWFCMNQTSWAGGRVGSVLRRLLDTDAALQKLQRQYVEAVSTVADLVQKRTTDIRAHNADREELETLRARVAELEAAQDADTTVYRAQHDTIVCGYYTNRTAARAHCEAEIRRNIPGASLDWIADDEDEEDGVAELVAAFGEDERSTGYVVEPLTAQAAYDAEADA